MMGTPKITLAEDGPLIVENPPNLTGAIAMDTSGKPSIALCRCGASTTKPFCDGSHTSTGFKSTSDTSRLRTTPLDYAGHVSGVDVTISYTPVLCTHAAECQKRAAAIFDPKAKPWIQPENGALEEIFDVISACPSGALRIAVGDQSSQHLTTGEVSISIEKNGPYYVSNVAVDAEFNGAGASRTKCALCRCGLSKNKPFCDGTHYDAKWSDDAPDAQD